MHKTLRFPAGLCARLKFSFYHTGTSVDAPKLEGAAFGTNRQPVNFQPDGQDALLLPTMPHGVWPYEVRADGTPILHGHIEVFPSPLAASHGTMEWQVDCDLAATVAAVAVTLTQGPKGERGQSAFEHWLEIGNTGTVQDFFEFIRGPQGEQGPQGIQGPQGPSASLPPYIGPDGIIFQDPDNGGCTTLDNVGLNRNEPGVPVTLTTSWKCIFSHPADSSAHLKPGVSTYLDTLVQRALLPPSNGTLATVEAVAPDSAFTPTSTRAQSGTAVLQAVQKVTTHVADYGLVTETLDLTGYTIDTDTRTAATDELWLEFGDTVPSILWPSNWIWLEGEAPTFLANTAYCICVRVERHGLLIANLAYEFNPATIQTNAD